LFSILIKVWFQFEKGKVSKRGDINKIDCFYRGIDFVYGSLRSQMQFHKEHEGYTKGTKNFGRWLPGLRSAMKCHSGADPASSGRGARNPYESRRIASMKCYNKRFDHKSPIHRATEKHTCPPRRRRGTQRNCC